jgi:hypothetical protein
MLRIPELVITLMVVLGGIVYPALTRLSFLKEEAASANILIDVITPQKNFWTCSEIDNTCIYDLPNPKDIDKHPYCKGSLIRRHDLSLPSLIDGCAQFDAEDITDRSLGSSMFVASAIQEIKQRQCQIATHQNATAVPPVECKQIWLELDGNTSRHYVAGFEDFLVKIRHTFTTLGGDDDLIYKHDEEKNYRGSALTGFLNFRGETEPRIIPCYQRSGARGCTYQAADDPRPVCGTADQNRSACFSNPTGDFIGLGTLLNAARVNIDVIQNTNSDPLRWRGLVLELEFTYTNQDPIDFWTWPWGTKMKYFITPRMLNFTHPEKEETYFSSYGISKVNYENNGHDRNVRLSKGIKILVRTEGQIGTFTMFHTLNYLVVSIGILAIGKFVVNMILVRLYDLFQASKHVHLMHEYHAREQVRNVKATKKTLQEGGSLEMIELQRRQHRAKMLERKVPKNPQGRNPLRCEETNACGAV